MSGAVRGAVSGTVLVLGGTGVDGVRSRGFRRTIFAEAKFPDAIVVTHLVFFGIFVLFGIFGPAGHYAR